CPHFFITKWASPLWREGVKLHKTTDLIRHYTFKFLNHSQYFVVVAGNYCLLSLDFGGEIFGKIKYYFTILLFFNTASVVAFYHYSQIYNIISEWTTFFTTIKGFMSLLIIVFLSYPRDLMVITFASLNLLWTIILVAFSAICFIQLKYVNQLLQQ